MSVVVPFYGDRRSGEEMADALEALRLRDHDEVIVVDNTPEGVLTGMDERRRLRIVRATAQASSYYARNIGVEHAAHEWIVFVDADCVPDPGLVDAYFAAPIRDDCGALAGQVVGQPGQDSLAARYARSRHHLEQNNLFNHPYRPMIVTANVLVRRAAWADIGGFLEGIRSAGDSDFSWRLQDAGWTLGFCPEAHVEHRHRDRLPALLRQAARYGAGGAWARRRHPDYPRTRLFRELARAAAGLVIWPLAGQPQRGMFKAIDGLWVAAVCVGELFDNTADTGLPEEGDGVAALFAATFPDEEVVAARSALTSTERRVIVEADRRPLKPDWSLARGLEVRFLEDFGVLSRVRAAVWLVVRAPHRVALDLLRRRQLGSREPLLALAPRLRRLHRLGATRLYALAGDAAAVQAHRAGRLLGLPATLVEPPAGAGALKVTAAAADS